MEYTYKLLNDGAGVVLTRQPEILEGDLIVTFLDAPVGAVALFKSGEDTECYRELSGAGSCLVPRRMLKGTVEVSVTCYDGTVAPQRWCCESLIANTLPNGTVVLMPDDNNLPLEVVDLKIANHKIREDFAELEEKFNKLSDTFTSMMEGYDLT